MSFDHYAAARALAERLTAEGRDDWAKKITEVMEKGATGTEVFMGLRWRLRQLEDCGGLLSGETNAGINMLLNALDRDLR